MALEAAFEEGRAQRQVPKNQPPAAPTDESGAPVICVDGPGGSGKSTLAKRLAEALGWRRLDSGALYRMVAAAALDAELNLQDGPALADLAARLDFEAPDIRDSARLRTEPVSTAASTIAANPELRRALLLRQRATRRPPGLVADGRDMGTVVFADAPLKIFLDASPEERANRRRKQLSNKGLNVSFRALLANILKRDARDRERAAAPLRPAEDAIVVDSTEMTLSEVVDHALALARERGLNQQQRRA